MSTFTAEFYVQKWTPRQTELAMWVTLVKTLIPLTTEQKRPIVSQSGHIAKQNSGARVLVPFNVFDWKREGYFGIY